VSDNKSDFILFSNDILYESKQVSGLCPRDTNQILHSRIVTIRGNSGAATVPREIGATSRIIFRF